MRKQIKKKIVLTFICLLSAAGGCGVCVAWKVVFADNIADNAPQYLHIPSDSEYEDVVALIENRHILKNPASFFWLARGRNYPNHVHAGRYHIQKGMSNLSFLRMLRSAQQEPVDLTFNNVRTKSVLARKIASQLELDSTEIHNALNNDTICKKYHLNTATIVSIFLPDTYEVWWNTGVEKLLERMYREYCIFWTDKRKEKAAKIGLTPTEVIILASIVEEENHRSDEQPRIAGLYINRLRKKMKLQADPTVKFAIGNFMIKQVLNKHLKVQSSYNTYLHGGLPPGPIRIPTKQTIDNVLNYEKHDYLYMCAKENMSGYHNFSKTVAKHAAHAAKYHIALRKYLQSNR
jgi:UPF0755 protein